MSTAQSPFSNTSKSRSPSIERDTKSLAGEDASPAEKSGKEAKHESPSGPVDERSQSPEASSSSKSDNSGSTADATESQKEDDDEKSLPAVANAHTKGDWQAIWSPQHTMYYFYNMRTKETTWTNPLQPQDDGASMSSFTQNSVEAAALAAGIDPQLAYLDPSLSAGPSNPSAYTYSAKFNARTGTFTAPDARNPDHVGEYERMRRMNSVFFDMDSWEKSIEEGNAAEEANKKRKKPTKKDLESFKERKKQKKLAKTAWLRT